MGGAMDVTTVEAALRRLGEALGEGDDVELLLVGGAAGMITGVLPATRITIDCDVMAYIPAEATAIVEAAAERVAKELGLSSNWLNSDVQIRRDALPEGWERRKVMAGRFGRLRVSSVSRPDLIAMKVLAGRDVDIDDLQWMRVRCDDVEFVHAYLHRLAEKGTTLEQIHDARQLLASLDLHEHE